MILFILNYLKFVVYIFSINIPEERRHNAFRDQLCNYIMENAF